MSKPANTLVPFTGKFSQEFSDYKRDTIRQLAAWLVMSGDISLLAICMEFEGTALKTALLATGGSVPLAARRLGVTEQALRYCLEQRFPTLNGLVQNGRGRRI